MVILPSIGGGGLWEEKFKLGGLTIGFGFTDDEENNAYTQTNGQMAKDLPFKFENARCMVLDEVSMIGTNLFTKISLRLQEILSLMPKWKFHSFGGIYLFILEPTSNNTYIYIAILIQVIVINYFFFRFRHDSSW